ncbi:alpha/beta fold hydrolase [Microbacterium sp. gxy059]|uniref:alpha/beta fold hydrolase n=1 Tax=Microbacterium sp. gxy059 TaxID=2957199 RepID=UPI003D960E85
MDVILLAGFWLDGSSWAAQASALERAGHRVHAPTLPGLADGDGADIGLQEQIDAVVALIDAAEGPVVLVGHSGGGNVAWGAADARPDRVAHVVFADAVPPPAGSAINDELPVIDGRVPFPEDRAAFFDEQELIGFTEADLERFVADAIPVPARVASDPIVLRDERRRDIPITVIATTISPAQIDQLIEAGHPIASELAAVRDRTIIDLPTSHWPQLTRPEDTARILVETVDGVAPRAGGDAAS